jgi:hypothetical protein
MGNRAMYRYDLPGRRRRVRPPRSKAYCKTCRALIGTESLNANGSCECCAHQLPLFTLTEIEGASSW